MVDSIYCVVKSIYALVGSTKTRVGSIYLGINPERNIQLFLLIALVVLHEPNVQPLE